MPSRYIRAGIARKLYARERSLHHIRTFFQEKVQDNLAPDATVNKVNFIAALELHVKEVGRLIKDAIAYRPTFIDSDGVERNLTPEVLAKRAANRERLRQAHADEVSRRKSRRLKRI